MIHSRNKRPTVRLWHWLYSRCRRYNKVLLGSVSRCRKRRPYVFLLWETHYVVCGCLVRPTLFAWRSTLIRIGVRTKKDWGLRWNAKFILFFLGAIIISLRMNLKLHSFYHTILFDFTEIYSAIVLARFSKKYSKSLWITTLSEIISTYNQVRGWKSIRPAFISACQNVQATSAGARA